MQLTLDTSEQLLLRMTTSATMETPKDVNCQAIKHVQVKFKQHAKKTCGSACVKLNNACSHNLADINAPFTSNQQTEIDPPHPQTIQLQIAATLSECMLEAGHSSTNESVNDLAVSCKVGKKCSPSKHPMTQSLHCVMPHKAISE